MSKIINIKVDNQLFTLFDSTLCKFQNCAFYKVLKEHQLYDFMFVEEISNTIYVDMDHESLKFILNYMRGYKYCQTEEQLLEKIFFDATRLNLIALLDDIRCHVSDMIFYKNDKKEVNDISDLSEKQNKFFNLINHYTDEPILSSLDPISRDFVNSSSQKYKKKSIKPTKIEIE